MIRTKTLEKRVEVKLDRFRALTDELRGLIKQHTDSELSSITKDIVRIAIDNYERLLVEVFRSIRFPGNRGD